MEAAEYRVFAGALQDAEDLHRAGRHREAFEAYERLLRSRLTGAPTGSAPLTTAAELVVVERLAQLALLMGCAAATDLLLNAATALCRAAGNAYGTSYYTLQRAATALEEGRLRDARERLSELADHIGDIRSIDISPSGLERWEASCAWPGLDASGRAVLFTRLYAVLGGLLAALGQYGQALHCLERGALLAGDSAPDLARRALPHLALAAASAELERGELARSVETLQRWQSVAEGAAEPALASNWLCLASKAALLEGRTGRALELLERLVTISSAARLGRAQAIAELNLAQLRIALNQTAAAQALVDDAAERGAALQDSHIEQRTQALSRLIEARSRSLADTVAIAPAVTQMWQAVPEPSHVELPPRTPRDWPEPAQERSYLEFFEDRALRLQWLLGLGEATAANGALQEMEAVFADTDSALIGARMQVLRAMLTYYAQPEQGSAGWLRAEALAADACDRLRRLGLQAELWQALRLRVWAGRRAGLGHDQTQAWSDEADALLARMSDSLDESARTIYLLNKWTADEETLANQIDALVALRREQLASPWWRRWALAWPIRQAVAQLMWRVDRHRSDIGRRTVGGLATQREEAAPSAPHAWQRWPRQQATLATLVLPDRTLVLAACGWRTWFGVSPVTRLQWREAVHSWHQALREAANAEHEPAARRSVHEALVQRAEMLSGLLQLPALVAQLPAAVKRLRFVPDDVLHAIPFAALRVRGRPIAASHAVCLDFEAAPMRTGQAHAVPSRQAMLLGIGEALGPYAALPAALIELSQLEPVLAQQGWSPKSLIDARGTPDAVCAALPASGLAHFACHGVFDATSPGDSGLVLAGPRSTALRLTLREVAQLNLSSLRHAGLSACWSADSVVLPGRRTIGLPETLRRAGAHSVLAWLWPAPDRYAAALTTRFYELLAAQRRDEALKGVQAEAMAGRFDEHLPPALRGLPWWSGLQLYGESSRLRA